MVMTMLERPHLRGWSHAAAFVAAVALCPLTIVFSAGGRSVAAVYSAAVIALFGMSAAYHRLAWGTRAEAVFQRLDHATIFVAIAATYTPVSLAVGGRSGRALLWVVWTLAGLGAARHLVRRHPSRVVSVTLYAAVGWSALAVIHLVWQRLGVAAFVLLLAGGMLHTLGAVVYALRWPNPWPRWFGFHEIFHLLVIGAVALHYVVVAFFAL
jgi:hemolysin III